MTTYRERLKAGVHSPDPDKRETATKKDDQTAKTPNKTTKASK